MNQRSPAGVALIGCGAVSQLYYGPALTELARHRLLEVVALCDPVPSNLSSLGARFPAASAVRDVNEIESGIDLAIVASPPALHAQHSIALLRRGMSVLCEKPMASSIADAEAMLATAATAPGVLAVGLFRRFFPAAQQIRDMIAAGMLGEINAVTYVEGGPFRWPVQSARYFSPASGNGVTLDIGVHALDLLLWWLGDALVVDYADDAMGGIEANCHIRCTFAPNVRAEVRLSRDTPLASEIRVEGRRGWLAWTPNDAEHLRMGLTGSTLAMRATLHQATTSRTSTESSRPAWSFQQSFMAQIVNVLAAMRGDAPLVVPAVEGIRSLRLIERCYRQRGLLDMPWLDADEASHARVLQRTTGVTVHAEEPGG